MNETATIMASDYQEFIKSKSRHVQPCGFDIDEGSIHPMAFPFQRAMIRWAVKRGRAAIFADCGLGKAQPCSEPVLTPTGWREIGGLRVGDEVFAGDGSRTFVIGVYPQGQRESVELTFSDGARTRCDWDHLWTVRSDNDASRDKPWRTLTTREIMDSGLFAVATRKTSNWRIPLSGSIDHEARDLPIDPYVFGALLGDGSFQGKASLSFTSTDDEVVQFIGSELPSDVHVVAYGRADRAPQYRLSRPHGGPYQRNPLITTLRAYGLWGRYSHEKWIPEEYLFSSSEQRLDLLRGLMDTDGYVGRDGTIQYSTSSFRLADDVVALIRSLGGVAYASKKIPRYHYYGEVRNGLEHHILTLALPDGVIPFRLSRKSSRCRARSKYKPIRKIVSIVPIGSEESVCIAVEHPSALYITRDYIVTHNTLMQLEWARLVGEKTLILTPLAVAQQTIREAARLGIDARYCRRQEQIETAVPVTNYEMLDAFDADAFGAVVLDESGILKNYAGSTKQALVDAFARTKFRLCCTATPAPNDHMELGNHAEFLGAMTRAEMLAMLFTHDGGETRKWRIKGHAQAAFWRWVCSWACAVRQPSDIGFSNDGYDLPPLVIHEHVVPADEETAREQGALFVLDARTLDEQRAVRRGSINARVAIVSGLVAKEPDEPWLLWCDLNDESGALAEAIPDAIEVRGSGSLDEKESGLVGFSTGETRVLVTKPSIAGHGLNFQHCARVAFVGVSHSFEAWYQAIRRTYRFGQSRPVHCHVVTSEAESYVVENLKRKQRDAESMGRAMIAEMSEITKVQIQRSSRDATIYLANETIRIPSWLFEQREIE